MSGTAYQQKLVVKAHRHRSQRPDTTIIIGGREYTEEELDDVDWDSLNEVTVNRTDNKQCR